MKSERRHELKTNTLSQGLEGLPDYWREYGNKVLLVIIVGLIVFMAVRYYRDKKQRDAEQVAVAQDTIRSNMAELDRLQMMEIAGAPVSAETRQRVTGAVNDAISTILNTSKDPKIIARAYIAQGDLDWTLANMPDPAGATTRPDLKIPNRDGLLSAAAESYAKVLDPPYSTDTLDVFTARMGLAAIAENRGKWDEARNQYNAIVDSKMPKSFKEVASKRLAELPEYAKAPVLNPPPPEPGAGGTPATGASTAPSILGPEAPLFPGPTTTPSTMPAPTTMPALSISPSFSLPPTSTPATQPGS